MLQKEGGNALLLEVLNYFSGSKRQELCLESVTDSDYEEQR